MLVLSRKKGQSIIIGDNIEITVVEIQGDTVRIGVNAPGGSHPPPRGFRPNSCRNQQAQQSEGLQIKLRQLTELSKQADKKDEA